MGRRFRSAFFVQDPNPAWRKPNSELPPDRPLALLAVNDVMALVT